MDVRGPDECWLWTGQIMPKVGYGRLKRPGGYIPAHRLVYEMFVGPIPAGLVIDHTCHNADLTCPGGGDCAHRRCVNPAHLEAVTNRENILRGKAWSAVNARKMECPSGHPYDDENARYKANGWRICRECNRQRARDWRRARTERNAERRRLAALTPPTYPTT